MIADGYFDFVSSFACLQSEQLASPAPRITIRYRPVLFAGLLGAPEVKETAAEFVAAGCRYDDPEYERVAALPVGASREQGGAGRRAATRRKA